MPVPRGGIAGIVDAAPGAPDRSVAVDRRFHGAVSGVQSCSDPGCRVPPVTLQSGPTRVRATRPICDAATAPFQSIRASRPAVAVAARPRQARTVATTPADASALSHRRRGPFRDRIGRVAASHSGATGHTRAGEVVRTTDRRLRAAQHASAHRQA